MMEEKWGCNISSGIHFPLIRLPGEDQGMVQFPLSSFGLFTHMLFERVKQDKGFSDLLTRMEVGCFWPDSLSM